MYAPRARFGVRYVTLRIRPAEGTAFHPLGERLSDDPAVERGKIHRVEALGDGTGLLLAEARGDVDRYREILRDSTHVREFSVVEAEGWWYAYNHFEGTPVTERMFEIREETRLAIERPIRVEADGSLVLTLVGPAAVIADQRPSDPVPYEIELLKTGPHHPEVDDLYLSLTERQREVLATAVGLGYYDDPRRATHADVADLVGIAPTTVGEHLRKVERRVFGRLVGSAGDRHTDA